MAADLRLDWCSHEAARYAVENWHYSKCLPSGKLIKVGVWERGSFAGVVIFSRGANVNIGRPYGLGQTEICELTRVALGQHESPTSRILAISLRMLRKACPGIRLVVSFADTEQDHHGGIYQANGWVYVGAGSDNRRIMLLGSLHHRKTIHSTYGAGAEAIEWLRKHIDPRARVVNLGPKHKYLMPLDAEMRAKVANLAKPYPKRAGSIASDAPPIQGGKGGATPTPALPSDAR